MRGLGVLVVTEPWLTPRGYRAVVLDPDGRLELVVADTDGAESLQPLPEFRGGLHGAGEAAWVKDGQVVTTSGVGFNPACFEPNTLHLLEPCRDRPYGAMFPP